MGGKRYANAPTWAFGGTCHHSMLFHVVVVFLRLPLFTFASWVKGMVMRCRQNTCNGKFIETSAVDVATEQGTELPFGCEGGAGEYQELFFPLQVRDGDGGPAGGSRAPLLGQAAMLQWLPQVPHDPID